MPVSIKGPVPPLDIAIDDLPSGKIARVTKYGVCTKYIGDIVQRWGDHLIVIGCRPAQSWPDWYTLVDDKDKDQYRCQILPTGTMLEINNNND